MESTDSKQVWNQIVAEQGEWLGDEAWLDTTSEPCLVGRAVTTDGGKFYLVTATAYGPQGIDPEDLAELRENVSAIPWVTWDVTTSEISREEAAELLGELEDVNHELAQEVGLQ